jgi:hypothetical protein
VSGNKEIGCDAIVISRQDPFKREHDYFTCFYYSSNSVQRAGALYTSYQKKQLIRVFRSSNLANRFAPPNKTKTTQYRYDGLYRITRCWDADGKYDPEQAPRGPRDYLFSLERDEEKCVFPLEEFVERATTMQSMQLSEPIRQLSSCKTGSPVELMFSSVPREADER